MISDEWPYDFPYRDFPQVRTSFLVLHALKRHDDHTFLVFEKKLMRFTSWKPHSITQVANECID